MGFNHHKITTNRTQVLSAYVQSTQFDDFPAEVAERAKLIAIRVIGEALAASQSAPAQKALALALYANGGTEGAASVWGDGQKLSMENVAMVNGTFANLLNSEIRPFGLPACGVIPTAWAVAEEQKQSGKELLTAIIVGYEVYLRVAMAVQPTQSEREQKGWGASSWQLFAALVPALKLMGHDLLQINKGLSMGTVCSIIPADFCETNGSDSIHYLYGFRNQTAVTLARNALRGTENLEDAFDDPSAYVLHFTDAEKPECYTQELGKTYLLLSEAPEKSAGEVANDFQKNVSAVYSVEKTAQILKALFDLENCPDISTISKLLVRE